MDANKHIIDCGGWEGDSVISLREKFDPDGKYICHTFEANPLMNHHYTKFKNHILYNKAVWIYDGEIDFHLQQEQGRKHNMGSSIFGRTMKSNVKEESIKVPCVDFSKWILNTFNKNDYLILKLDIEGAEYKVLNKMIIDGSIEYINDLYIEFHHKKYTNLISQQEVDDICSKIKIKINTWV